MTAVTSFLIGLGITLFGSLAVVIYLRRHLQRILTDLCGTPERAGFWTAFSNVTLVLVPLICALFGKPGSGGAADPFFDISEQLKYGLIGLVAALFLIGLVLRKFIPPVQVQRSSPLGDHLRGAPRGATG